MQEPVELDLGLEPEGLAALRSILQGEGQPLHEAAKALGLTAGDLAGGVVRYILSPNYQGDLPRVLSRLGLKPKQVTEAASSMGLDGTEVQSVAQVIARTRSPHSVKRRPKPAESVALGSTTRLTRASSYALHAVAYMAQQKHLDRPVATHHIAAARGIPERFLLKVLKPLVSARVLLSIKGPNGGYRLARTPDKISMLEILEAVDGPIRGITPFSKESDSPLNHKLEAICKESAEQVRKHLNKITIAELLSGKK